MGILRSLLENGTILEEKSTNLGVNPYTQNLFPLSDHRRDHYDGKKIKLVRMPFLVSRTRLIQPQRAGYR